MAVPDGLHLPVHQDHAIEAGTLARHHGDPVARMPTTHARLERMVPVTTDPVTGRYDFTALQP